MRVVGDMIFELAILSCIGLAVAGMAGMFWSLWFHGPGWPGLLFMCVTLAGGFMASLLHDAQSALFSVGARQERPQQ